MQENESKNSVEEEDEEERKISENGGRMVPLASEANIGRRSHNWSGVI